jgi:hypothetical protein
MTIFPKERKGYRAKINRLAPRVARFRLRTNLVARLPMRGVREVCIQSQRSDVMRGMPSTS